MTLTAERARSALDYNPETGQFVWKLIGLRKKNAGRKKVGDAAGCIDERGYVVFRFDKKKYYGHQIAWLITHGYIPKRPFVLDHVNRNKSDNRISNLRLADRSQNVQNVARRKNNTSGHRGVSWSAERQKWVAVIRKNGRHYHLGYFDSKKVAAVVRSLAADKLYGEFACHD